jgi:uncharacterized protein YodC (DUF2158 family)
MIRIVGVSIKSGGPIGSDKGFPLPPPASQAFMGLRHDGDWICSWRGSRGEKRESVENRGLQMMVAVAQAPSR